MQSKNNQLHVFIIVNRLYEWSQNFITRELTELNEHGVRMHIAAREIVQRDDLTEREKKLLPLAVILPENPFLPRFLIKHLKTKIRFFGGYLRAWRALFSLKHKPSKFFRSVVCLFRAAAMAEWVVSQKINLIHAHFLTAPTDTALYLSKITGIPYGATAYAMDIYVDKSGIVGKLKNAAYVNGTTLYNENSMKKMVPAYRDHIVTRYYGIHTSPELMSPLPHQTFNFIAVGRLVEKKGFKYLIEACDILKHQGFDFHCEIIGKGPLEAELAGQIKALQLESHVSLTGYMPPNKMQDMYRKGDVLVAPCVIAKDGDVDGLPNVCLEAMNYGLPVISTTISGIPEGVNDGVNGWLIPPNDAEELAEAMRKALQTPDLLTMRIASHRMVCDKFDVKKNALLIRDLLERHRLK